jgi:hypothetical protein
MKAPYLLMIPLAVATGCTFSSGRQIAGENPYVDVAAGAEVYFDGPPEDAAPTLDLKLGYRWPGISVDAALVWTHNMSWSASQCEPEFECMSRDRRDLVGIRGAMQLYILKNDFWLQPYLMFGLGIRTMHYHEVVWAGLFLLGGGAEISLLGGLSLNVGVLYSVTRFEHGIGSPEGNTNQAILPMGGLRFYF